MPSKASPSSKNPVRTQPRARRRPVLHLCLDLEADDPARNAVDLALVSQRSGWRALMASAGGRLVADAERAAVSHRLTPFDKPGFFSTWRCRNILDALIEKERPSILHAHGFDTLEHACLASQSHNIPLIADITQPAADHRRARRQMAALAPLHSLVRVPTAFMGRHVTDDLGFPLEQVYHVPPGVDLQVFNGQPLNAERLATIARLWRLPEHGIIALMPLPLVHGMGHDIFLKALTKVLKEENVFAVLIGSDRHAPGLRAEIEDRVSRLHLQGQVVMPEFCNDWPAAFWLSSFIVAPNTLPRGENRALLAAQAMGRPALVTASGGNPEMVKGGETGWIVPPDDAGTLADAMRQAITLTTEDRLGIASQCREFISATFPRAEWFREIADMYETLLGAGAGVAENKAA